jgi:hypothetical protein
MKTVILFGESQRKLLLESACTGGFFAAQSAFFAIADQRTAGRRLSNLPEKNA